MPPEWEVIELNKFIFTQIFWDLLKKKSVKLLTCNSVY